MNYWRNVRIFCWVYLAGYFLDAAIGIVSLIKPSVEPVSDLITSVMLLFSYIVFIMACTRQLNPRKLFLTLPSFYFFVLIFSIFVAIFRLAEHDPITVHMALNEKPGWYIRTIWFLQILGLLFSSYGIHAFNKAPKPPLPPPLP